MKKLSLLTGIFLAIFSLNSYSQQAPIRGEVSPGVYENLKSTNQALNVAITATAAASVSTTWTQSAPTVTSTSSTLLAANANRKLLVVQNNSATGTIYLAFDEAATVAKLALAPGQSVWVSNSVPVSSVTAIGSIASNANVVVISGE